VKTWEDQAVESEEQLKTSEYQDGLGASSSWIEGRSKEEAEWWSKKRQRRLRTRRRKKKKKCGVRRERGGLGRG
jgi:hypothetical protein